MQIRDSQSGWVRAQRDLQATFGEAPPTGVDELPPMDQFKSREFGQRVHQKAWKLIQANPNDSLAQADASLKNEYHNVVTLGLLSGLRAVNDMAGDVLAFALGQEALRKTAFRKKLTPVDNEFQEVINKKLRASVAALKKVNQPGIPTTDGLRDGFEFLSDESAEAWLKLWSGYEQDPRLKTILSFKDSPAKALKPLYDQTKKLIEDEKWTNYHSDLLSLMQKRPAWRSHPRLLDKTRTSELVDYVKSQGQDGREHLGTELIDFLTESFEPKSYVYTVAESTRPANWFRYYKALDLLAAELLRVEAKEQAPFEPLKQLDYVNQNSVGSILVLLESVRGLLTDSSWKNPTTKKVAEAGAKALVRDSQYKVSSSDVRFVTSLLSHIEQGKSRDSWDDSKRFGELSRTRKAVMEAWV